VHGSAFEFAVGVALFHVVAFVEVEFALADGEGDFDTAIFPVKGEGDNGVALDGTQAEEFADLGFVKEELADGLGLVILAIALGVFVNVDVIEINLIFFNTGEGVADLALAGAERFDFGAVEDDSGLEGFENVIVPARFGIGEDVGHKQQQPEDSFRLVARLELNCRWRSVLLALFCVIGGLFGFGLLGHVPAHFVLDDFFKSDVGSAHIGNIGEERMAHGAGAGVKLAHAA
jgi:hypothetical protein